MILSRNKKIDTKISTNQENMLCLFHKICCHLLLCLPFPSDADEVSHPSVSRQVGLGPMTKIFHVHVHDPFHGLGAATFGSGLPDSEC